jgi:hypothetical protein
MKASDPDRLADLERMTASALVETVTFAMLCKRPRKKTHGLEKQEITGSRRFRPV